MGKPLKIERIEDMSRLLWLEHVITEASLMTRSIRLHSILMNWMCFPLQTHPTMTFGPPFLADQPGGRGLLTKNMT